LIFSPTAKCEAGIWFADGFLVVLNKIQTRFN